MARIISPPFRLSFPNLWQPRAFGEADPKYDLQALFPEDPAAIRKLIEATARDKWGEKVNFKKLKLPIKDAGEKDDLDGYEDGWFYARFATKERPQVLDNTQDHRPEIDPSDPDGIYAGCWCVCTYDAFAYEFKMDGGGMVKGVSLGLGNVLKIRDDDRFGGARASAEDEFASYGSADDDTPF